MVLNKQKGNMYNWVTHTWNPIKGKCPHKCSYCYMKRFKVGELRLDEKALKDNLGEGNFIFVGSSTDMFAKDVPTEWIIKVLNRCNRFSDNTYLFQTKNPGRFPYFAFYPKKTIFGTTIETNRDYKISKAQSLLGRYISMTNISGDKMVSIEPILDFDLDTLTSWIINIQPKFVSIGADSKGHNLPEPTPEKVRELIEKLKKFTEVKIKDNLKQLKEVKPNSSPK